MQIHPLEGLKMPFQATLATRTNMRLEAYGVGKRSGRGLLNKALNLALERLAEDLDAGRVSIPEDWFAAKPRRALKKPKKKASR